MNPNQSNSFSMTRMLGAVALTFVFFSAYSYFFPQEKPVQTTESKSALNPQTQEIKQISSPVSKQETPLLKISSKDFEIEFDSLGRVAQVYLKDKKYAKPASENLFSKLFGKKQESKPIDKVPLLDSTLIRPLEVRFADEEINQKAFSTPYSTSSSNLVLSDKPISFELVQNLGTQTLSKHITIYPDLNYEIKITSSNPSSKFFLTNGARPIADSDEYAFLGTILQNDGTLEKFEKNDVEGVEVYKDVTFLASVDRYFTTLLYEKDGKLEVLVDGKIPSLSPIGFVSIQGSKELGGYIGAKNYQELKALYAPLGDVVEYGLITFFAKPLFLLLEVLHNLCGNWGWAIVMLTILVRVALFPLSYKGMIGMQKLKDLAPQMKQIQAQYKDDPQKMQKHIMELYKKNGANPLGGCLPLLLQIPVFFAIYKVLYCAVELKAEPWILWIHDLSVIDPYYILPLVMGVTMYISQIMTPTTYTDPMQEKVFKLLPLFFTIFFIIFPFPAGLVLYWSVNNILSIIQQMIINRIVAKQKEAKNETI